MGSLKVKGVILKTRDFKERDKLLYVATPDKGKITIIAKGARGKKSKIMSLTQPMLLCDFVYFEGKNIHSLNEISLSHSFSTLKNTYESITYASYFLELMDLALGDNEANYPLFMDFLKALYILETNAFKMELIARAFEVKVLLRTGNQPSPMRNGAYIPDGPRGIIRFFLNKDLDKLSELKYEEEDLDYVKGFTGELLKDCFQRRPRSLDILEGKLD